MKPTLRRYTAAEFLQQQGSGTCVVDVRPATQYASFYLQGTLQIGIEGPFASWAAMLLAPEQKILLIGANVAMVEEAYTRLQRVGLHHVIGYMLADKQRWREDLLEVRSLRVRQCAEIAAVLSMPCRTELIDVRSKAEWLQGHVPGASCVPLLELMSRASRALQEASLGPVLVYCNEGFRAMIAASILSTVSADVEVLIDGIGGWTDAGFPLLRGDTGSTAAKTSQQSNLPRASMPPQC